KCHSDEPLAVPLEGLHIDDKLQFVEEPVEIMEREIKRLKRSRIPLVKVRWNSRRGPEFTWEREDSFKKKYPHLFINRASSSTTMGGAVDWKSTKESIFATSSIDVEYIIAFDALKEAVWIRKFISGLGVVPTIEEPINMYSDNSFLRSHDFIRQ
ncbi:hypothetical protein Tco_1082850, partial [Tanacetum coccineum]